MNFELTQNTGVEIGGSLYFFHPKKDVSMESYLATSQPLYFFTQPALAVYVCDLLFKQEIKFSLFTAVQHRTHPFSPLPIHCLPVLASLDGPLNPLLPMPFRLVPKFIVLL